MAKTDTWTGVIVIAKTGASQRVFDAFKRVNQHPMREFFFLERLYGRLRVQADERWPQNDRGSNRAKVALCLELMEKHFNRVRSAGLHAELPTIPADAELKIDSGVEIDPKYFEKLLEGY